MKKNFLLVILACFLVENIMAQSLALNTDGSTANASAMLDVKSINKGVLIPPDVEDRKECHRIPCNRLTGIPECTRQHGLLLF